MPTAHSVPDDESLPAVLDMVIAEFIDVPGEYTDVYSVQDINNGYCREFAERVQRTYTGDSPLLQLSYGFATNERIAHAWLWSPETGKHYDAQAIDGVETPTHLPVFEQETAPTITASEITVHHQTPRVHPYW